MTNRSLVCGIANSIRFALLIDALNTESESESVLRFKLVVEVLSTLGQNSVIDESGQLSRLKIAQIAETAHGNSHDFGQIWGSLPNEQNAE